MIIKNFDSLAITDARKSILKLVEAGLLAVQPHQEVQNRIKLSQNRLTIHDKTFDLQQYERVFLLGFGKGSGGISKIIEQILADKLTGGYVIDVHKESFSKIQFTLGTHPLPSEQNYQFTKHVIESLSHLTQRDLVLIVICGGGSAMFVAPQDTLTLAEKINVNRALLRSGANIHEMNIVRKHLSKVKGGGLARILHPATGVSIIFSDVPGNDLNTIASGPTVKDPYTVSDAKKIIDVYKIEEQTPGLKQKLVETPKDDSIFQNVTNILFINNDTALKAMQKTAEQLGWNARILSNTFEGEARIAGKRLIQETHEGEILLAAGETTVIVHGNGVGGRNQELVLGAVDSIDENTLICSFGSDGHDNSDFAGAIGDKNTFEKAKALNLSPQIYLNDNNSFEFFRQVGDGIDTGILPSNVSDLMIVLKKKEMNNTQDKTSEIMFQNVKIGGSLNDKKLADLEEIANKTRQLLISTLLEAGSGHSAGPLGMADIFTAFYFHILNHNPKDPDWDDRDRLILSNGHICPVRYVSMALSGYFPVEELKTLRKLNSRLQGHPHRSALPGVETTSGPLGEGLSQALGMALAAKLDHKKYHIYCVTSDGEHEEGNTWEAVLMAAKYKLDNLTVIMDRNNIQIDGFTEEVLPLEALRYKYEAFNWNVFEVDGHNIQAFVDAVQAAKAVHERPTMIIAHTIPGKGVDFMENDYTWHGKPPNAQQAKKALDELRTLQGKITSEHQ